MRTTAALTALLSLGFFGLAAGPIQANSKTLQLEEVVVTATKRETSLQDTAIAVTAFTGELLDQMDINSPFDFEALVPSLTYQQSPNKVSIRGVGRFTNAMGASPGVAIYNDGIYQPEATSMASQPINTQRTEVLRGPQGTLYGRNTTGGAVNVISRKPTSEFVGDFRVRLGNYDLREYALLVSGPVTDKLRYKFHLFDTRRDGLQENIAGNDIRSSDATFIEGQLDWDVTERFNVWFKYSELASDNIPGNSNKEDPYDCVNVRENLTFSVQKLECDAGRENASLGDNRTVALDQQPRAKLTNSQNVTARLSYDFEAAQLSYLYGLMKYDYDSREDYDQTPNPDLSIVLDIGQYQDQTTHELQLTSSWDRSWNYLLGAFYFKDENEQPYNIRAPEYEPIRTITNFAETWDNPLGVLYFQNGAVDNESFALYGEVGIDLNEQWSLTLGARYSDDEFKGAERQLLYYDLGNGSTALDVSQSTFAGDPERYVDGFDAYYEHTYENTTGKISLNYRPRDGHLLWGTIANGFKMGGVRLGALEAFYSEAAGVESDGFFDQEDMLMYELGWKADLFDNTLFTEAVVYFNQYDDMQETRSFQTPPPGNIDLDEVVNFDTEMFGIELSASWLATDNLRFIGAFSYMHSEVVEDAFFENRTYSERDENGDIIPDNIKGNQVKLTPEYKGALSAYYLIPSSAGDFSIGGTWSYVGKRYFDLGNYDNEGSYTRVDAQASWTSTSGRYKVLGSVTNLFDEDAYNTRSCDAAANGTFGTDSWIIRCGGNRLDQRLYAVQFNLLL